MAKSCIVSRALEEMQDQGGWSEEKEDLLKGVSSTIYSGMSKGKKAEALHK